MIGDYKIRKVIFSTKSPEENVAFDVNPNFSGGKIRKIRAKKMNPFLLIFPTDTVQVTLDYLDPG